MRSKKTINLFIILCFFLAVLIPILCGMFVEAGICVLLFCLELFSILSLGNSTLCHVLLIVSGLLYSYCMLCLGIDIKYSSPQSCHYYRFIAIIVQFFLFNLYVVINLLSTQLLIKIIIPLFTISLIGVVLLSLLGSSIFSMWHAALMMVLTIGNVTTLLFSKNGNTHAST
jgi:hypothetical protein